MKMDIDKELSTTSLIKTIGDATLQSTILDKSLNYANAAPFRTCPKSAILDLGEEYR